MTIKQLSDILKTYDYVITRLNLYHGKHCYLIYNDRDVDINAVILSYKHNHIQWNADPGIFPTPVLKAMNKYVESSSKAWSLGYHAGWENTKHAYQKGYKQGKKDTKKYYAKHGADSIHIPCSFVKNLRDVIVKEKKEAGKHHDHNHPHDQVTDEDGKTVYSDLGWKPGNNIDRNY